MMPLGELYRLADKEHISVVPFPMESREALSLMDDSGECHIALDPGKLKGPEDHRAKLAHELGHCMTGAFYNRYATCDLRQRHENRADKWAVRTLVPVEQLDEAVAAGCTELWQLAEHFGLPEPMMKKAVCLHVHGNLAAELYF